MKRLAKIILGLSFVVFLVTAYSGGTKAVGVAAPSGRFIEVCSNGTVYLPPGTRFVTCQGKVMRVIAIVSADDGAQLLRSCDCPDCCGGGCAVTVSCGSGGGLCTAYLSCGD